MCIHGYGNRWIDREMYKDISDTEIDRYGYSRDIRDICLPAGKACLHIVVLKKTAQFIRKLYVIGKPFL